MLKQRIDQARRAVEATRPPTHDSIMFAWCLDAELDGNNHPDFAEEYFQDPKWLQDIDLERVCFDYVRSTISPGWHTSNQDWYPRKRTIDIINYVFTAHEEDGADDGEGDLYYAWKEKWGCKTAPWEGIEAFRDMRVARSGTCVQRSFGERQRRRRMSCHGLYR
jgi:hypothetical protein